MIKQSCRPLWTAGVTWAVVCLVGAWVTPWLWIVVSAAVVSFLMALAIRPLRDRRDVLLILGTVAVAAAVLWYTDVWRYCSVTNLYDCEISLTAVVLSHAKQPNIRVLSGDLPVGTVVRLAASNVPYTLHTNDVISETFLLKEWDVDGLSLLLAKASGVWCSVTPVESGNIFSIDTMAPTIWSTLSDWRLSMATEIQRVLPFDIGAVITGICFGEDTTLSLSALGNFRICGTAHLFAVSGLHLSVLTQALLAWLTAMRVPRRLRGAFGSVAVAVFMVLMGPAASVTRAGAMCLLVMLGECFRRQADARNSMGIALLILLVGEPFGVYDAGLLLSFLATCGILFLTPRICGGLLKLPMPRVVMPMWKPFASAMAVTLAAGITTLPVMVIYFGSVSLIGVLINPIVTLPAMMILVLGWITVLPLTLGMEWVYRPLLLVLGWISRGILWITERAASLPFSALTVSSATMTVWLIGSVILVYSGYRLFRYRGVCVSGAVSVGLFCIVEFLF